MIYCTKRKKRKENGMLPRSDHITYKFGSSMPHGWDMIFITIIDHEYLYSFYSKKDYIIIQY